MPSLTITDLNNAKLDVDHIAEIATSTADTATDRLGHVKKTLAGAVGTIAAINNRGPWISGTAYALKDLVSNSGIWYICVSAHTAGATFSADEPTKWRIYQGAIAEDLIGAAGASMIGYKLISKLGAKGDAVTNDTTAFTNLEAAYSGFQVDLGGKTYLVDRQFTNNSYQNGYFKRSSDGHVFKAGRGDVPYANRGAETTLKSQSEDSRYSVPIGLNRAIVVLGDSISHGAFQGNLYQDGWVNVLKRMLNAETGSKGYGFAPLLTLGSGATLSKEVHDVSISGAWAAAESTTGGEDIIQGLSYTSSTAGDYIQVTVPTFQRQVRVWYVEQPGGGTFSYAINGGAATNVSTSAATRNTAKSIIVPMNDNGAGSHQLKLSVVSGSVTLCGVGYEMPPNEGDQKAGNVVQNFSQSGRRLKPASEGMIDLACQGSVLILALGYNDYGDCAADSTYNAAFQQRIDWVVKYCLKYNTTLVVADFCWWAPESNPARTGLKRAATEARGLYVPLPDYLTRDQLLKTEYADSFYMVDTLKKWSDGAHPNVAGAKWIAETVAKAMGLSCTSKEQAMAIHDFPFPLQFDPASIFKNQFTQMPYLSCVQRVGNSLVFSVRTTQKAGGSIPAGTGYALNVAMNTVRQFSPINVSAIDYYMPINLNNTGAVSTGISVGLWNDIKVASFNPYLAGINYSFTLPLDVTAKKA